MPSKVFDNATESGPQLSDVAQLIKQGKVKNIIFLVGAGISTSAGIPDFRSPETGLYANLEKYNLPYPEAIFDIQYLYQRPEAFFTLAKELYPGNFKPTLTHYFMRLVHEKKLLKRVFTQNVDTLEQIAGLDEEMIVAAHGSFATATCMNCKKKFQAEELKSRIATGEVLRCQEQKCKGKHRALIKSDIVFFGEALPGLFFKRMSDFKDADLLITIGTSLKVHPFASLIDRVDDQCPRLLINLESVGEIDEEEAYSGGTMFGRYREDGFDFNGLGNGGKQFARDVKWLGEADKGVRQLAQLLGWESELDELYETGHADLEGKAGKAETGSGIAVRADAASAASGAEIKAEETAAKIGETVDQPSDTRQVDEARKTEEETFDKLAQELDKLGVQTTGTASAPEGADKDPDSAVAGQRDESDKRAAL